MRAVDLSPFLWDLLSAMRPGHESQVRLQRQEAHDKGPHYYYMAGLLELVRFAQGPREEVEEAARERHAAVLWLQSRLQALVGAGNEPTALWLMALAVHELRLAAARPASARPWQPAYLSPADVDDLQAAAAEAP